MPTLTFFGPSPTRHNFKDFSAVGVFADQQAAKWEDFLRHKRVGSNDQFPVLWPSTKWAQFASVSRRSGIAESNDWSLLQSEADKFDLITFENEAALTLREIAERFGSSAMLGALRGLGWRGQPSEVRFFDSAQLLGLALIADSLSVSPQKSPKTASATFREQLADMEQAALARLDAIEKLEVDLASALEAKKTEAAAQAVDYEEWRTTANDQITETLQDWQNEWSGLKKAFGEELRIRAPIEFWTARAKAHRVAVKTRARQLVGWGALGAGATTAMAVVLFDRLLFDPSMARFATALERAAIAASGTLFFATIFLWAVRILARLFVSEQHLSVDAEARAAMAYTYLSLVKKGAVSESERSIVLEALFRPVNDGMVRDDAMPNFTPAALVSGTALKGQ